MANIVIVSTTNSITTDFGIYASALGFLKATWNKSDINHIDLEHNEDFVRVYTNNDITWKVSFEAFDRALVVDSIDAVVPSSNLDLYNKLIELIA